MQPTSKFGRRTQTVSTIGAGFTASSVDKAAPIVGSGGAKVSMADLLGPADEGDELAGWKAERRGTRRLPWRQISIMAGISFGIGSLVLPDSVNGVTNIVLYVLMGLSFYAGLRKKRG